MLDAGAYSKVEGFGFLPITCFSMGLTTFISQILGAKKYDRAKKGARIGILCSISMAEIVGIIVYFASPVFIAAFNNDPKVIAFGVKEAHIITLFYFLLAFSHCIAGLMRGAGRATVPNVCYAGLLVRDPCDLYNHRCEAASGDPDCILGVSADLVIKLHSVFDFLSEIRLDPWF